MNLWVVVPTYNEAANLESMVATLLEGLDWGAAGPASVAHQPSPRTRAGAATASPRGRGAENLPPLPLGEAGPRPAGPGASSEPAEGPGEGSPGPRVTILVVDDDSPDGTGDLAERLAREREGRVHVLHRARKLGLGSAYLAGFSLALARGAEVVVEMDADFSHSPDYLPQMVALLDEYDVVVGSRWVPGGRLDERWEPWRYLLSKYANVYARWVTGLSVYDTTAGFKAFRGEALRRLPLHRIRSDGYAFQIEVATACQRCGLRVAELPIYFTERVRGQSKMTWRIILEAAWRVWQIRSRW